MEFADFSDAQDAVAAEIIRSAELRPAAEIIHAALAAAMIMTMILSAARRQTTIPNMKCTAVCARLTTARLAAQTPDATVILSAAREHLLPAAALKTA